MGGPEVGRLSWNFGSARCPCFGMEILSDFNSPGIPKSKAGLPRIFDLHTVLSASVACGEGQPPLRLSRQPPLRLSMGAGPCSQPPFMPKEPPAEEGHLQRKSFLKPKFHQNTSGPVAVVMGEARNTARAYPSCTSHVELALAPQASPHRLTSFQPPWFRLPAAQGKVSPPRKLDLRKWAEENRKHSPLSAGSKNHQGY